MEWSLTAVQDLVSGEVPDRDMLVWEGVRKTHGEVLSRSRRLAACLLEQGMGIRRERPELERWQCGQSPVALILHNCPEYIEAMSGCFRARAVPFNVNHYYSSAEVSAVLNMVGAEAVIYHRSMAPMVADALGDTSPAPHRDRRRVRCRRHCGQHRLRRSHRISTGRHPPARSLARRSLHGLHRGNDGDSEGSDLASGRHLRVRYGWERGRHCRTVLWRRRPMGSGPGLPPRRSCMPQPSGLRSYVCTEGVRSSCTTIAIDSTRTKSLRPCPASVSISCPSSETPTPGPWLKRLNADPADLSSLLVIGTGGAITSEENKQALLRLLPHVTIRDGYGASETGGMAFGSLSRAGATRASRQVPARW